VIGLLWVRHHGFFRELVRIDSRLIWLNIVYLGLVAFLPFPTELIGDNVDEPDAIVIVPGIFLTSIPLAFVSTTAAQLWWVGLLLTRRVCGSAEA
jgi:TMEM175 potassium channel family protein